MEIGKDLKNQQWSKSTKLFSLGISCPLLAAINAGFSTGNAWGKAGKTKQNNVFIAGNSDKCDS